MSGEWLVAAIVAVVAAVVNWIYFSRTQAPGEVPDAGHHLPRALPGVRARLHGLHRLHQLRHRPQRLAGAGGLVAHGLVAAARRGLADLPASRSSTASARSACSSPTPTATPTSAPTTSRSSRVDARDRRRQGRRRPTAGPSLTFADVLARTDEITELAVPFSDDPNDGALRTPDGSSAYQYVSTLEYDEAAGTMTDVTTGTVYSDIGTGAFTSDDGEELLPGWQITVGFDNFVRAVTDPRLARPARLRDALDLRVRAHLGRLDVLPRPVPRDRVQRHAHARPQVLPRADDPAVRVPVVPVGADLGGHDERELRVHQPGAARRGRDPLAHGSDGWPRSRCSS